MKPHIIMKLTELLHENNKYVKNLKTAVESMNQTEEKILELSSMKTSSQPHNILAVTTHHPVMK